MTATRAAVRRYTRAPLVWVVLVTAVVGGFATFDLLRGDYPPVPGDRALEVTGVVERSDGAEVVVGYEHPLTGERLSVDVYVHDRALRPDGPGRVDLVADRLDPGAVALRGDRVPGADAVFEYGWLPLLPAVVLVLRIRRMRQVRRLVATAGTSYAMLGAVVPARWARRCRLHLYPLDAPPGSAPVCAVPLVTTSGVPLAGAAVPVEVKGAPRPHGLVVARAGDLLLWPAGRAVVARGLPRPVQSRRLDSHPGPPAPPSQVGRLPGVVPGWWLGWQGAALLAAAVLATVTTVATLQGARAADRLEATGTDVIGTVVAAEPDGFGVRLEYTGADGRAHRATAAADFAEDYVVGRRYPIVVSADDPEVARLRAEPYDAVEPIVLGLIPLALILGLVLPKVAERRRLAEVCSRPWRPVDAWAAGDHQLAIALPGSDQARCVVPVAPAHVSAVLVAAAPWHPVVGLEAAGELAPGEAVALRAPAGGLAVRGVAGGWVVPRPQPVQGRPAWVPVR